MKTIALLAVGAFMTAGTAFATAPTNGNLDTQTVKSDKSTGVIVAGGKNRSGFTTSSGSGFSGGRTIFGG
ncbi:MULTISPECIES: hypothetical protein [Ochrobactrum]|uniref:Uncharacterized protein n=2 Tax=Ochrobactrum TaxID=528 RepID=A0ABD5JW45_9HYPH|nr:hypothetical protein [[Ochrobactrum] soli]NNU62384.1 hypothetical protein [[Ochrobactrum] soli]